MHCNTKCTVLLSLSLEVRRDIYLKAIYLIVYIIKEESVTINDTNSCKSVPV